MKVKYKNKILVSLQKSIFWQFLVSKHRNQGEMISFRISWPFSKVLDHVQRQFISLSASAGGKVLFWGVSDVSVSQLNNIISWPAPCTVGKIKHFWVKPRFCKRRRTLFISWLRWLAVEVLSSWGLAGCLLWKIKVTISKTKFFSF